ncbi:MAG: PfkB family carbohydrate kinase [Eubacteriales bacterium]|nr:PfkB family carbohydrate kinase [Eubacteriales bacterium]
MKRKPSVIAIGICVVDIYRHHNRMYPGGNEFNVSYNAMLQGATSAFMGVFADDKVGDILEQTLVENGIDTSRCHHEHGSSGWALVDLVEGDRVFVDWNTKGVTDLYPFSFTDSEIAYIKTFDIASTSKNSRISYEKFEKLAKAGVKLSYDFNDNFTDEDIERIAPCVKIGFFSGSHLTEKECRKILKKTVDKGCEVAVVTRGGEASIAFDGEDYTYQEVMKVKATDTMGAGDSFISAFLTNYFSVETDESNHTESKIKQSLKYASEYAATVVVKDGSLGVGYDVDPNCLSDILNL